MKKEPVILATFYGDGPPPAWHQDICKAQQSQDQMQRDYDRFFGTADDEVDEPLPDFKDGQRWQRG